MDNANKKESERNKPKNEKEISPENDNSKTDTSSSSASIEGKTSMEVSKSNMSKEISPGLPSKSPNVNSKNKASDSNSKDQETVEQLKNQLSILMNSLSTLSVEKSKMEANFQVDKKSLRSEREECEKVIKDLKEKLKKIQSHNISEMEHVKCKLITERHERDKERADHNIMIRDLQKLLNDERRNKEQLEAQLKSSFANKTQCKILEAELEITKNKLKQAEEAAKETPPLLITLQTEMAVMKKQHRIAIHEEQKRATAAEQRARALAMTHETRVVGLESRLAELSETVGGYDRLRQQDQHSIQKLKDQLANLQDAERKEYITLNHEPEEIAKKIKTLYGYLSDLDNQKGGSTYIKSLLNSLGLCDKNKHTDYKDKYETLFQEFEDYKQQVPLNYNIKTNMLHTNLQLQNAIELHDKDNNKTKLHLLKTHNSNLEERIRMLNNKMMNKEKELQMKLDHQQKLLEKERIRLDQTVLQKENEFRSKIFNLEQQLLRQRERSMSLVQEKDKEILTLKASFHALIPKKEFVDDKTNVIKYENKATEPVSEIVTGLLTNDSPPILYYTQEMARKEVQISTSRKRVLELEALLREKQRHLLHLTEKQKEELKALQTQIARLEACKSREGANLEYLKNVFINYLTTNDISSKRHILNAISTVLRFTSEELSKVNCSK